MRAQEQEERGVYRYSRTANQCGNDESWLAVLRRMLRLAHEWRMLDRIPKVRLLRDEKNREFVLNHAQEKIYLEFAPLLLRDLAMLIIDTGLDPGEALGLEKKDINFKATTDSPFGFLQVREGKTPYRPRSVSLTGRVQSMLRDRCRKVGSSFAFAQSNGQPPLMSPLDHANRRVRERLKPPPDFVLYSLRHTALTRLGEEVREPSRIMRIAGHSSITTSQRYAHSSTEAVARAIAWLDAANKPTCSKTGAK